MQYSTQQTKLTVRTCLHLATYLGDFHQDLVVVGGLVPSLLNEGAPNPRAESHAGTLDVDLGLSVAIRDQERYDSLADRLARAGFAPDRSDVGNLVRQRWRHQIEPSATVEFLFPEAEGSPAPGNPQGLTKELAAIVVPGLDLAFLEPRRVLLQDVTLANEVANREVLVCAPAPFVVLKALAFNNRGADKDAYDLAYMLLHGPDSPDQSGSFLKGHEKHPTVESALAILRRDFFDPDAIGPARAARFTAQSDEAAYRADLVGAVRLLLKSLN